MAGTVTLTSHLKVGLIKRLLYTTVGDASDGSFPDTALPTIDGKILAIETDPGSTAPTDNWDLSIEDSTSGADILGTAGANRDTANGERVQLDPPAPVSKFETVEMKIGGNIVNSANIVVKIYYEGAIANN